MRLLYKPVGILLGLLSGMLGKRVFDAAWEFLDAQEPPTARTRRASWVRVVGAAAVQGASFAATRAAVDRAGAKGFEHVTGVWPGPKEDRAA